MANIYYWNDGAIDKAWDNDDNWWDDVTHLTPAGRIPADGDSVYLTGTVAPDAAAGTPVSLARFDTSDLSAVYETAGLTSPITIASGGDLVIGKLGATSTGHKWEGATEDNTITALFQGAGSTESSWSAAAIDFTESSVHNGGTLTATTITHSDNSNFFSGSKVATVVFEDDSTIDDFTLGNTIAITGNVTFNDTSEYVATVTLNITGNVTYNNAQGLASALVTITGDAHFVAANMTAGTVTGEAEFDSGTAFNGGSTGDLILHAGASANGSGDVDGVVTAEAATGGGGGMVASVNSQTGIGSF